MSWTPSTEGIVAAWIEALLTALPEGTSGPEPLPAAAGDSLVVALVEGWRGEICHVAISEKTGNPYFETDGTYFTFLIGQNPLNCRAVPFRGGLFSFVASTGFRMIMKIMNLPQACLHGTGRQMASAPPVRP